MSSPLIVTAKMDAESFEFLTEMRRQNFPPERNFLSAHITFFHHLPGEKLELIRENLKDEVAEQSEFPLNFSNVRFMGRGTAIIVESAQLFDLRAKLANRWQEYLTPQDRQKFNAHVTVQNKVEPKEAKIFYEKLKSEWEKRFGFVVGLELWAYCNGPWRLIDEFLFKN